MDYLNFARRLATLVLFCGTLVFARMEAFGQPPDSMSEMPTTSEASQSFDNEPANHSSDSSSPICAVAHLKECLKDLARDQAGIWTSPLRIKPKDAQWLLPFAGATALSLHYDAEAQQALGVDKNRINASNIVSGFGSTYATAGMGAGLYLLGVGTHNRHLAETGRLGAEAVIDASLVAGVLKVAGNRERPDEGQGNGGFWPHGTNSFSTSFPSGHAASSWALARVIAAEYPTKSVQIGVYAFASIISISRVTARKHFPTDALVGGTFGYLIGDYVVHHHGTQNSTSSFYVVPMVDAPSRTFGLSMELRPERLKLAKISGLANRVRLQMQGPVLRGRP